MTSGTASLAWALYLGKRRGEWERAAELEACRLTLPSFLQATAPRSSPTALTPCPTLSSVQSCSGCTSLLLLSRLLLRELTLPYHHSGWFGFNGGSELAMNLRSMQASMVTNIAAAMGGLTWLFMDYFRTGKYSAVSLCSGVVAGLVG
jgi:ammonia channel protein AmtB